MNIARSRRPCAHARHPQRAEADARLFPFLEQNTPPNIVGEVRSVLRRLGEHARHA